MDQPLTTVPTLKSASQLTLPFIHLNLRFNPFGEIPLKYQPELAVIDAAPLIDHLARPRAVLQLIGEKGRGKTTHLLAIKEFYPKAASPKKGGPRYPTVSPSYWMKLSEFPGGNDANCFKAPYHWFSVHTETSLGN